MAKKSITKKNAVKAIKQMIASAAKKAKRPVRKVVLKPQPARDQKIVKKIKCPLSKAELLEFRQILLEKRRAIIGDMNGIEAEALHTNRQDGSGDLSNMPTHPADIGTDNFEQEFTLGLLESERTLLTEINAALDRIDGGTYGVCVGTGQPIGVARLRARPWAKYCIDYARKLEKGLIGPDDSHREDDEEQNESSAPTEEADEEEEFVEEEADE